jgi:hypothetical protein
MKVPVEVGRVFQIKKVDPMKPLILLVAFAIAAGVFSSVSGGTIISTNLSSGDVIININGQQDGAAAFGGSTQGLTVIGVNQDDWYRPFNTQAQLLEYTFQPGTYRFRILDQTDAAALFPSLTQAQLNQIGGAWTYNAPWVTDYLAFDSSAATNPNEHQLFAGAVTPGVPVPGANGWIPANPPLGYDNAADAYNAAKLGGYYDEIVTGTGRYTGTVQTSYTFAQAETLIFAVPDYYLFDNSGIVSVLVSSASVPEPSSLTLATLAGALFLGARLVRRRTR